MVRITHPLDIVIFYSPSLVVSVTKFCLRQPTFSVLFWLA